MEKLKNAEVKKLLECLNAFEETKAVLPLEVWLKLAKNNEVLKNKFKEIESVRTSLVKQYGRRTKEGNVEVIPSKLEQFTEDYAKLMEKEFDGELELIEKEELKSVKELSGIPGILLFMKYLIKD